MIIIVNRFATLKKSTQSQFQGDIKEWVQSTETTSTMIAVGVYIFIIAVGNPLKDFTDNGFRFDFRSRRNLIRAIGSELTVKVNII